MVAFYPNPVNTDKKSTPANTDKKSTIYMRNITNIDYAYLHPFCEKPLPLLLGGSFAVSMILSCCRETEENVTIDFSSVKKLVKHMLDQKIDHKFYIPKELIDTRNVVVKDYTVVTRSMVLKLDESAIVVGDYNFAENYIKQDLIPKIVDKLVERFKLVTPPEITFVLDEAPTLVHGDGIPFPSYDSRNYMLSIPFSYVHGLSTSSSFGCQNLIHGHNSSVTMVFDTAPNEESLSAIDRLFDDPIFIDESSIIGETNTILHVKHHTKDRGTMSMTLIGKENVISEFNVHKVPGGTPTIEQLAEYLREKIKDICKFNSSTEKPVTLINLFVSEGLDKGAIIDG